MDHPHLSPELNALVARGNDPTQSISLREMHQGQIVELTFGDEGRKSVITIKIETPAGSEIGRAGDAATGTILLTSLQPDKVESFAKKGLPNPPIGIKCTLTGSCRKDKFAPLGMTMLHFHTLSVGRNIFWSTSTPKGEAGWLFSEVLTRLVVR